MIVVTLQGPNRHARRETALGTSYRYLTSGHISASTFPRTRRDPPGIDGRPDKNRQPVPPRFVNRPGRRPDGPAEPRA